MDNLLKKGTIALTLLLIFAIGANISTNTVNADSKTSVKTYTDKSTKKSTKVVKLKKKSKNKKTTKVTTKKSNKTYTKSNLKITKNVTKKTTKVTKIKSKKKTITTTIRTTTKTTEQPLNKNSTPQKDNSSSKSANLTIESLNGTVDPMIIKAFKSMNYKIKVNPSVKYQGCFDGTNRTITLKSSNKEHLLHELGHYVAFITGNRDKTSEFKSIYNSESSKYSGSNKAYVTQNTSEYFAESLRDFYTKPATLKKERPKTYNYIEKSIDSITDSTIDTINSIYYS